MLVGSPEESRKHMRGLLFECVNRGSCCIRALPCLGRGMCGGVSCPQKYRPQACSAHFA